MSNLVDLDILLKEWYHLKKDKSKLDDREEEIKSIINKIMKKEKTNKLEGEDFVVTKKYQKKKYLSKNIVPEDIWDKYKKETEYSVLYLKRL